LTNKQNQSSQILGRKICTGLQPISLAPTAQWVTQGEDSSYGRQPRHDDDIFVLLTENPAGYHAVRAE